MPTLLSLEPTLVAPGRFSLSTRDSPLWKTFPPSTRVQTHDDDVVTVSFPAKSVISFKDLLSQYHNQLPYSVAVAFFHGLVKQFTTLSAAHQLFSPFYDPRNIIVIDGRGYIANPNALISIIDGGTPYTESAENVPFIPPEVHLGKPNLLTPACGIYTLAALTGASIFPHWAQRMSDDDITEQLHEIVTTPLYWCLLRCLAVDPEERVILYL
jgi:hypothetical protein